MGLRRSSSGLVVASEGLRREALVVQKQPQAPAIVSCLLQPPAVRWVGNLLYATCIKSSQRRLVAPRKLLPGRWRWLSLSRQWRARTISLCDASRHARASANQWLGSHLDNNAASHRGALASCLPLSDKPADRLGGRSVQNPPRRARSRTPSGLPAIPISAACAQTEHGVDGEM